MAWGAVEDESSVERSVGEMVIGNRRRCGEVGVVVRSGWEEKEWYLYMNGMVV